MATVHFPGPETRRVLGLKALADVPFILTGDEDYPERINDYIRERAQGFLAHDDAERRLVGRQMERGSAAALARSLADLLTWAESAQAHPRLGAIAWKDIRYWQIVELYRDALMQGFWSEAFFITGEPRPISAETVRNRVSQALACYRWMAQAGDLLGFDTKVTLRHLTLAKDDALLSYRLQARQLALQPIVGAPKRLRQAPGSKPLPTVEHLIALFETIPSIPHRLAAMILFEAGLRPSEVVENTLIPGKLHQRDHDGSGGWYRNPEWPRHAYTLRYDLSDNRMIGVIPTREVAWNAEARLGYQCDYRILGKNRIIRKVHLPPNLLRRIWKYIDSPERGDLLAERLRRGGKDTAHLFLNKYGEKLSYPAIWASFDAANRKLGAPQDITPHELRHAYACYSLEQAIISEAQKRGFNESQIPRDLIEAVGNTTLLTIQLELGHAEFRTTRRYLRQLADGAIRFATLKAWNGFLDRTFPSE